MSVINKRTTNNITLSYGKKPTTARTPKRTTTIFSITSREVSFDLGELQPYYKYTWNFLRSGGYFPHQKLTNCRVPWNVEDPLSDDEAYGEESVGCGQEGQNQQQSAQHQGGVTLSLWKEK